MKPRDLLGAGMRQFLADIWSADPNGDLPGVGIIAQPVKWTDRKTGEAKTSFKHEYASTLDEAVSAATRVSATASNAYFAPALFRDVDREENSGNRVGSKATGASAFWFDIDVGDKKAEQGEGYSTRTDALRALIEFCRATNLPKPLLIISSGYGVHVYWLMSEFVPRRRWLEAARKLKALSIAHKFLVDQSRTADIASLLRPVGTHNFKNLEEPQPVAALYPPEGQEPKRFDLRTFEGALDAAVHALPQAAAGALDASAQHQGLGGVGGNITTRDPPLETPGEIAKVQNMLAAIPPDCDRATWRQVIWAALSTGWECAEQLAREWSSRSKWWHVPNDRGVTGEEGFERIVADFNPDGGTGYGTLAHIAKAAGYEPPTAIATSGAGGLLALARIFSPRADQGDVTNAAAFAQLNVGRLCHVLETDEWLRFDPVSGWLKPEGNEADRAAKAVLGEMSRHAAANWRANPKDDEALQLVKHVKKAHDLPRIRAMIELAKSEPGMSFSLASFDADPMLLGVGNGVLNLKTGALSPMSPNVLVSKRANAAFDPSAVCPQWEHFLSQVQPDQKMRKFLRRLCGYILTGSVRDHIFPVVYGEGGNGKGVFLETVAYVLGDYSVKIGTETLMEYKRSPQAASPDLMSLRGVRFAYCSETTDGQRLDAARVKELTGGDRITARPLYGSPVTFTPSHKLMLMGNYKPEVSDMSDGMWRRMILIPFDVKIPNEQQDLGLPEMLRAEAAGILNWALAGLRDYLRDGLQVPEQVSHATNAYKDENDLLRQWLSDECEVSAECGERKGVLYSSYETWGKANGIPPISQPRFTRRLGKQFHLKLAPDHRTVLGVRLRGVGGNL